MIRLKSHLAAALIGLAFSHVALAADAPLPSESPHLHLGAASCAGTTCHGAATPTRGSSVQQNEFLVWERQDAHSRAFKALQSDAGRRIASNLGLKSAADAECMGCHSDAVVAAKQGKRYRPSEGVSCEACHGGSEKWLGPHVAGTESQASLQAVGLYPLADPVARAKVCLSCHQSNTDHPVTHKLLGAGHPPLNRFELDTYTATQPAHFRIDADYRKRKPVSTSAKTWIVGQTKAAAGYLDELLGPRFVQHGAFPELSFYDCDSCHHPMKNPRWTAGVGGDLAPGDVRLSDASLTMVGYAIAALAPQSDAAWQQNLAALRKAGMESVAAVRDPAKRLKDQLAGLQPLLLDHEPTPAEVRDVLGRMTKDAEARTAGSYLHAAQTTMAVAALTNERGSALLRKSVDGLFKATESPVSYDPASFRAALKTVQPLVATIQ